MTINFDAFEFETADEAIQHANASGRGVATKLRRQPVVVEQEHANRLDAAGINFAYLCDHEMPNGSWRILTIPVN